MSRDVLAELFRDIRANPEDDVPRLILGDWLLDQGDPRGEFVQIDVRLLRLDDPTERAVLSRRRRELLRDHAMPWLGPLLDAVSSWDWRRGLLHLDARASVLLDEKNWPLIR
ncbi:MAG: TIGR02996 domain-containing protein, partial [Gemmataceae bacterium]|nr:TIGR02996 domain-containing protein [Gemmataceae bacterium]